MRFRLWPVVLSLLMALMVGWWLQSMAEPVDPPHEESSLTTLVQESDVKREPETGELWQEILSAPSAEGMEPLPFKVQGRVRLLPGQSAVVGFWQISPDTNGMAVVTPEVQADGSIQMKARMIHLTDAAVRDSALREMLPAPFDIEQYGSLDPDRLETMLAAAQDEAGVELVTMPRFATQAGREVSFQNRVSDGNGRPVAGYRMDLTASDPTSDGSLDLDLRLEMP